MRNRCPALSNIPQRSSILGPPLEPECGRICHLRAGNTSVPPDFPVRRSELSQTEWHNRKSAETERIQQKAQQELSCFGNQAYNLMQIHMRRTGAGAMPARSSWRCRIPAPASHPTGCPIFSTPSGWDRTRLALIRLPTSALTVWARAANESLWGGSGPDLRCLGKAKKLASEGPPSLVLAVKRSDGEGSLYPR